MQVRPLRLHQDPAVYPPSEDSYFLATFLPEPRGPSADVGTGSGVLACVLAFAGAPVIATDVNPRAVVLARRNAVEHDLPVAVLRADLLRGVRARFADIAFNPPYLREAPGQEWIERSWAGDGLLARFLGEASRWLQPGGRIHTLLLGDDGPAWRAVESGWRVQRRESRRFFFEEVTAVTLAPDE